MELTLSKALYSGRWRHAMRGKVIFVLALASLFSGLPAPSSAEEPTGFAEFRWGTSLDEINLKLFQPRCRGFTAAERDPSPLCQQYLLEGLGIVKLGLDFTAKTLQGYTLIVPRSSAAEFKTVLAEKFGKPSSEDADGQMWRWPSGTTAIYVERSPLGGWLWVSTQQSLEQAGKNAEQRRDQIKRAF